MPSLDDTLGVAFLSLIFVSVLYGVSNLQTYIYFSNSKQDSLLLRWTIFFLWILDCCHFVFLLHRLYYLAIVRIDDSEPGLPSYFSIVSAWTMVAWIIVSAISDFVVRVVFSVRVWKLSTKNVPLACSFAFTNLFALIMALAFPIDTLCKAHSATVAIQAGRIPNVPKHSWLLLVHLATVVLSDALVTTSLCVLLWRARTGIKRTDSVLRLLMLYSINTGLLTSVFAIVGFIMFLARPFDSIYVFFFAAIPKLYFSALLANLNARDTFRQDMDIPVSMSQFDKHTMSNISFRGETTVQTNAQSQIQVKTLRKLSV